MTIPPWQFSKGFTPQPIKWLLQLIAILSLSSVLVDSTFTINTQQFLAASPDSYYWQLFTGLFFIPAPFFSFSYLLDLAFSLLILWLIGSLLYDRIGKTKFFSAYILSGLLGVITALFVMGLTNSFYYTSGCLYAILGLATLWTMSDPHQQLFLFFVLPIRAKWLLIIALAGTILANLIEHNFAQSAGYLMAFIFSWLFGLFVLGFQSPFDWMVHFDRFCKKIWCQMSSFFQWRILSHLRTSDERFLDKTLEKISLKGQKSLTFYERMRLKWISFKKKR
jgi:membrane associated rhomboid family serine protease